jgi:hypothetical protein
MIEPDPGSRPARPPTCPPARARASASAATQGLGTSLVGIADRDPVDAQELAGPVVCLDQGTDGPPAGAGRDEPRCRPDPALELVADHPRPAAHGSLRDRAARRPVERRIEVLGADVEAIDVVQDAVVGLADDRQGPELVVHRVGAHRVDQQRIVNDPDRMRVRDRDRARQEAGFADPLEAGQLAVAVEAVAAGEDGLDEGVAVVRDDHGHARPDRPFADDARPLPPDQRRVPNAHAGHVRDGVERARPEPAQDDSVIACAHAFLPAYPLSLWDRRALIPDLVVPGPPARIISP